MLHLGFAGSILLDVSKPLYDLAISNNPPALADCESCPWDQLTVIDRRVVHQPEFCGKGHPCRNTIGPRQKGYAQIFPKLLSGWCFSYRRVFNHQVRTIHPA